MSTENRDKGHDDVLGHCRCDDPSHAARLAKWAETAKTTTPNPFGASVRVEDGEPK